MTRNIGENYSRSNKRRKKRYVTAPEKRAIEACQKDFANSQKIGKKISENDALDVALAAVVKRPIVYMERQTEMDELRRDLGKKDKVYLPRILGATVFTRMDFNFTSDGLGIRRSELRSLLEEYVQQADVTTLELTMGRTLISGAGDRRNRGETFLSVGFGSDSLQALQEERKKIHIFCGFDEEPFHRVPHVSIAGSQHPHIIKGIYENEVPREIFRGSSITLGAPETDLISLFRYGHREI